MARRLTARCFIGLCAWSLLTASLLANEEGDHSWIRGVFTGNSPRPRLVVAGEASGTPVAAGELLVVGRGRSMLPLYPAGTRLVVRNLPYPALRSGQTVVYRNRAGRVVAHLLVARTRDGWRVRGLNNRLQDMEPVRADNLLGVVVAAYTADSPLPETRTALFLSED